MSSALPQTRSSNCSSTSLEKKTTRPGLRQQRALMTGAKSHVMFGRNEGGGQRFHGWLERLLETDDDDLSGAVRTGITADRPSPLMAAPYALK